MKHKDFILKKPSGHINVKTKRELVDFLVQNGWEIKQTRWRPSHIPLFRYLELIMGYIPLIGPLFRRKIAAVAIPKQYQS